MSDQNQPTHAETKLALLAACVEYRNMVGKLERDNAGLRGALEESQEYGRNHANAVIKLLSVISRIRRAVDEQPNKSQAMRLEDVGDLCDEVLGKKAQP